MLSHLLKADPSSPRLTVYDEKVGARLDFSALTLDNWAAKVGNMLNEEFDLEEGNRILIDLPVNWHTVVIVLGALAAGVDVDLSSPASHTDSEAEVVFTSVDRADIYQDAELVIVTEDPFGRGVVETGGVLPEGAVDFGPGVRFFGDQYPYPTQKLPELLNGPIEAHTGARVLGTGWSEWNGFRRQVLEPLAVGGSTVIVAGMVGTERLSEIAEAEKIDMRL